MTVSPPPAPTGHIKVYNIDIETDEGNRLEYAENIGDAMRHVRRALTVGQSGDAITVNIGERATW